MQELIHLPNLRPDWCMNVTKLKMYYLSFLSQIEQKELQDFY